MIFRHQGEETGMFKFDGPLVQVEMGLAALQRYSSKDTRGLWRKLTGGGTPGLG